VRKSNFWSKCWYKNTIESYSITNFYSDFNQNLIFIIFISKSSLVTSIPIIHDSYRISMQHHSAKAGIVLLSYFVSWMSRYMSKVYIFSLICYLTLTQFLKICKTHIHTFWEAWTKYDLEVGKWYHFIILS